MTGLEDEYQALKQEEEKALAKVKEQKGRELDGFEREIFLIGFYIGRDSGGSE